MVERCTPNVPQCDGSNLSAVILCRNGRRASSESAASLVLDSTTKFLVPIIFLFTLLSVHSSSPTTFQHLHTTNFLPQLAEARPKYNRPQLNGKVPPPYTVSAYSLSSACSNEMLQWCPFRTPFQRDAINCLESHKTDLSPTCREWHNARIECQSQIEARARDAGIAAEVHQYQRGVVRAPEAGAGGAYEKVGEERGGEDGGAATTQYGDANHGDGKGEGYYDSEEGRKECGELCKQFCGEGRSLLLCMRAVGKTIRDITNRHCYESAFAKSVVRSLNRG